MPYRIRSNLTRKPNGVSFSDLRFIFYILPCIVLLHTLSPQKLRNPLLFLGSLLIYVWGAGWEAGVLLLALTLLTYLIALLLSRSRSPMRRALLFLSLALNLGTLFLCKYFLTLTEALRPLFGADFSVPRILLPLGISFYVFQLSAYLIDVYRDEIKAETNFLDFGAFVVAYPQLVMGPILRYEEVHDMLKERFPSRVGIEQGFQFFCLGLSFKVLLADQLAYLWEDLVRIGFSYISTPLAWLGAVGYGLQLYFDFYGYSLMAIGLGRMLYLPVAKNFNQPYLSRSVSEFYRRWHITLGTWFRDYVYIPLGGSRHGTMRALLSLAVVWLLTGIWHGPTINFLLWGGFLFLFITMERLFLRDLFKSFRILPHLYLLFVIMQSWVIFHIDNLADLAAYFSRLYPFFGDSSVINPGDFQKEFASYWWLLAIAIFLCLPFPQQWYLKHRNNPLVWIPLFALFWISVYFLATGSGSSFLYFRF